MLQRQSIYEIVTTKIISQLEQGVFPWYTPQTHQEFAQNYVNGNIYTGINWVLLNLLTTYDSPYYLTWEQIENLGGHVKRGTKAEYIYYYKNHYKHPEGSFIPVEEMGTNEPFETVQFLKPLKVFNSTCVGGIQWVFPEKESTILNPIEECEVLLQGMQEQPLLVPKDPQRAFYCPEEDGINIPPVRNFTSEVRFYNVLLKQIVYWTGGRQRLSRRVYLQPLEKDDPLYIEEELVAEIAMSYLCRYTGLERMGNLNTHEPYLQYWITAFQNDPKLLFRAAPKAQQAVNFILGFGL